MSMQTNSIDKDGLARTTDGKLYVTLGSGSVINNPTITGGSITGVSGVPTTITAGGIPLVGVATGTMANNGAMTIGTALPLAYPSAFYYMPAGSVAAGVPAAATWLYGTASDTTHVTLFNNSYSSGTPTIPASPTAFATTGPGAFTGDTGEEFGVTLTIPANSIGSTGAVRASYYLAETNNANSKSMRIRWSGNAGTVFILQGAASNPDVGGIVLISNEGATNVQFSEVISSLNLAPATRGVGGAIDTTAQTTLVFSLQRGVATDNFVLLPPAVEVVR